MRHMQRLESSLEKSGYVWLVPKKPNPVKEEFLNFIYEFMNL